MKQQWHHKISSILSLFNNSSFNLARLESLPSAKYTANTSDLLPEISKESKYMVSLIEKILKRGSLTFVDYEIEKTIINMFGKDWEIEENQEVSSINYSYSDKLIDMFNSFSDFVVLYNENIDSIKLDPKNPQNERRLLKKLKKLFGEKIINYVYPQVELSSLLSTTDAPAFIGQRLDFLLSFPNGKSLILEPGDHNEVDQKHHELNLL